jgi:hypothetical protein
MRSRRSTILLLLLIVNALLLPVGCVPALLIVNTINPMSAAFVTDIHITNATDIPIKVTPIGAIDPQGTRRPLPVIMFRFPVLNSDRRGGFDVRPGETIEILYDHDDHNLAELVIELPDGRWRQLVLDAAPTTGQFRTLPVNRFTIASIDQLEDVPSNVMTATREAQQPQRLWLRYGPFLFALFTFKPLLRAYRESRIPPVPKSDAAA